MIFDRQDTDPSVPHGFSDCFAWFIDQVQVRSDTALNIDGEGEEQNAEAIYQALCMFALEIRKSAPTQAPDLPYILVFEITERNDMGAATKCEQRHRAEWPFGEFPAQGEYFVVEGHRFMCERRTWVHHSAECVVYASRPEEELLASTPEPQQTSWSECQSCGTIGPFSQPYCAECERSRGKPEE